MAKQKKTNQAERAYQDLRRMLLEHGFESGAKLGEIACAEKLGVNRGDARMAMARLYSEGLLARGEKCGYRVPRMTAEGKKEIYEVRLILETAAARLAVKRATKSDLRELKAICDDMALMSKKGYGQGVCEADLRFHESLIQAAHNSKLTQIYRNSNLPLTFDEATQSEWVNNRVLLGENVQKHRLIYDALEKRNTNRLVQLLEEGMNIKE
jgi:DNA-binding GntR family transcriptional regulator